MSESLQMEEVGTKSNLKLELSRVVKASRERVFAAWSSPELIQPWWQAGVMRAASVELDLRIGGRFRIEMSGRGGTCQGADDKTASGGENELRTAIATGVYREIVANKLLSFTWNWEGSPDGETLVTVALEDEPGGGTRITLTHERFETSELRDRHEIGWGSILDHLQEHCNA